MPFGNLGPAELIIILAIALIVFGPKKLPEIGKGIGNALREFNKARNDFMETLNAEVDRDETESRKSYDSYSSTSDSYASNSSYSSDTGSEQSPDALPYGGDFSVEGESQPAYRTAEPSEAPTGTVTAAPVVYEPYGPAAETPAESKA